MVEPAAQSAQHDNLLCPLLHGVRQGRLDRLQPPEAPLDILALEVGYGLVPLVDVEQNGELLDRIRSIRRQIALELGVVVPPIRMASTTSTSTRCPGCCRWWRRGGEMAHRWCLESGITCSTAPHATGPI